MDIDVQPSYGLTNMVDGRAAPLAQHLATRTTGKTRKIGIDQPSTGFRMDDFAAGQRKSA